MALEPPTCSPDGQDWVGGELQKGGAGRQSPPYPGLPGAGGMGREAALALAAEGLSFLCILLGVWPQNLSVLHPKVWAHQTLSPSPSPNPSHMAPSSF